MKRERVNKTGISLTRHRQRVTKTALSCTRSIYHAHEMAVL